MLPAVVAEGDVALDLSLAIECDSAGATLSAACMLHENVIAGGVIAISDLELLPVVGDAGLEGQPIAAAAEAEDRLQDDTVEPSRGARIPGPAAAAGVGRLAI